LSVSEVALKANKIYNLFSDTVFIMFLSILMTIIMTKHLKALPLAAIITRLWGNCGLSNLF